MKKQIFSWVLALSLLLSLLPASAGAATEHSGHSGWTELTTIHQNSFSGGGSYCLSGNVTYSGAGYSLAISKNVTLCLNGHTLDMDGYDITVASGVTLTICDCSPGQTGTIKGRIAGSFHELISVEGGTLNLESGTISSEVSNGNRSLISVTDGGTLNVTGGTISLNHTSGNGTVQAVKLSNSTGSFTGGEVSLTTELSGSTSRATTVYQEGGTVTVGGSAALSFQSGELQTPGSGALCVTQSGEVTVEENCTITASRTDGSIAAALSIGMLTSDGTGTGTATITGGEIKGGLAVYGTAEISGGSFANIQNYGTLTMTGGTVGDETASVGDTLGIIGNQGTANLSGVTITAANDTGIGVSNNHPNASLTLSSGVTITATRYGVEGGAILVGAPSISGGTADLHISSMDATTASPPVDATGYTGDNLTVQEKTFPDAHQGGYTGYAIKANATNKSQFQLTNGGSFTYQYDEENSALRLYNQNPHPICGGSCSHEDAPHTSPAWQKWSAPSDNTLTGGSYYLTNAVTLSQPITVTGDVNLCLNGNTIKTSDGSSPFQVTSGSLTICDCQTTGRLTGGVTATGGHIGIYGGTLSGGEYAVDLSGSATLTLSGSPDLSGTSAALKLDTQSGTALENAAVDATDYTGSLLEVEETNVSGGVNGFAIKGGENRFSLVNNTAGYHYAYENGGYVIRPDHTHDYRYSASGNTITETCTCGHSAKATINAPTGLIYDDQAKEATVAYTQDWAGERTASITYQKNGEGTATPINAGEYTASITIADKTARVTFTIGKASQAAPTDQDYSIDYENETITVNEGCKIYIAQNEGSPLTGTSIADYLGKTLYIRKEATENYNASGWTTITLALRPDAPNVTAEPESIKGKGDGRVTGVADTMEYSTDGGYTWKDCTGTAITDLAANTTVTVRVKATGDAPHGLETSCTIPEGTKTLTVTFDTDGGSAVDQKTGLSYDTTITAPAEPTKTGYTFDGWYREEGCTTKWDFNRDTVTDDITLYAKWTANTDTAYRVNHWQQNLNGGDEHNDANYTRADTEKLTGATGADVTPSVKSYDGFTAPGAQTVTIAADGSTVVDYYYTRNSYTVTLTAGTGIASVTGGGPYQYGAPVTIDATVSEGYAWSGWSDPIAGQSYQFTMGAADVSYTAQATPVEYPIRYELDGGVLAEGESNPEHYTVESGPITLHNPTKTGCTFAGWTGTGLDQATESVTIPQGSTGERTYTATWTANTYEVALHTNGGTLGTDITSYTYGTAVPLPAPARPGYTFVGWYENEGLSGDPVTEITATDTGDKVFYAKWTMEPPTVKLTADKTNVTYGGTITLTAAASHSGGDLTYVWYRGSEQLSGEDATMTLSRVADSGSYTVEVTATGSDGQQTTARASLAVSIAPKAITATWSGLTQVYGATEPVKATLSGVLNGDDVAAKVTGAGQAAGSHKLTAALTGAKAGNYTLQNATATLTIQPKPVLFTVADNGVQADGSVKHPAVAPDDTRCTYTVTYRQEGREVAAPTEVGSYGIWVTITDPNYRHTDGSREMQVGVLTITQAPPVLYTVSFAGGEGAEGSMSGLEGIGGSLLTLPDCEYRRDGDKYQFTGWLYNGKVYQPGDRFTIPGGNVTFTAQWQEVFAVSGTITEQTEGGSTAPVKDAVVSLWLGANKISEAETGESGTFQFEHLVPGIYNLVVTKDVRTVTRKVEIQAANTTCNATLPQGATNSIVEVAPGSPDIVVGNLDTVFQQEPDPTVYTKDDQKTVKAGGKVEITFTAEEKQKGDAAISNDMDMIGEKKDDAVTVGLVMDYKLEKTVTPVGNTSTTSTPIFQSNVLLELLLPLPAELQGKASYSIYRVHDGQVQELKQGESGKNNLGEYFTVSSDKTGLTLYVKCFSTYAVGYSDAPVTPTPPDYTGGGSSGGGSSAPSYPPTVERPEHGSVSVRPSAPQKGDRVTITPVPDEGYTVDEVTVTDGKGQTVAVTPHDDGTYTFVQPAGKVTITVTFRPVADTAGCPRDESCPMAPFTDADRNAWYHDGVHYCVEHGLMVGTGNTTFAPDIPITRGMIVTILWRLEGSPRVSTALDYADVRPEDWYAQAVRWADSVGVITGYGNGKFGPNDTITREQMAAMLWRYAGSPGADGTLSAFVDGAQTSDWAQPAMIWAVEQGLITGVGNDRLEPRGQATRAQAATILMRFAQNMAQ